MLSWLLLRGRCRDCGEPISARYPLVELATGPLFAADGAGTSAPSWALPAYLYLAAIGVALALIDLDVQRLPNEIVLPSYVVVAVLLVLRRGRRRTTGTALLRAALGGAALYAFYFVLLFVYPAGMGFGDVKLAGVLGIYLGWLGWGELVVGCLPGLPARRGRRRRPDGRSSGPAARRRSRSGRSCLPVRYLAILVGRQHRPTCTSTLP